MNRGRPPLFLARAEYRRRRLRDAVRLLPVIGAFLFLLPVLWQGQPGAPGTAAGGLYLFAVWALLVIAAAVLAPWLGQSSPDSPAREDDRDAL